jgi:hypothetical protein
MRPITRADIKGPAIYAGMRLLGLGEGLEPLRELGEALVARGPRHAGIHLRVLVGLAGDRRLEIRLGLADRLAGGWVADLLQEVEVPEGVPGLGVGGVLVQAGDVGKPLDVGDARKVEVAAVRLRFARERVLQVGVALGAAQTLSGHEASCLSDPGGPLRG